MSGRPCRQGAQFRNLPAVFVENFTELRRDIEVLRARINVLRQQRETREGVALGIPAQERVSEVEQELRVIKRVVFLSLRSSAIIVGLISLANLSILFLSHLYKKWDL